MNIKKKISVSLALTFAFANSSLWASSHLKKGASFIALASCALSPPKEDKVIENRKGESFIFHGDGTVSVKDVFNNDLGTYNTNTNNPLPHQNIELIKEENKSGVFVGLGLNGGMKAKQSFKRFKAYDINKDWVRINNNTVLCVDVFIQKTISKSVGDLKIESIVTICNTGTITIELRSGYLGNGKDAIYSYSLTYKFMDSRKKNSIFDFKVGPIYVGNRAHFHKKVYDLHKNAYDCGKIEAIEIDVTHVDLYNKGCIIS